MDEIEVLCITQARVGSSRLPKKVLLPLGNDTLLGVHLKRLKEAKKINQIVVATTDEPDSDNIVEIAESCSVPSFKGSLNDVLDRYYQTALIYKPKYIVRVTSDCPLIDPELIDEVIERAIIGSYDYYANIITEDFPDGQDVEVFTFKALEKAWKMATESPDREHVTPLIRNNCDIKGGKLFKGGDHKAPGNFNGLRMTVDEQVDLEVMQWLVNEIGTGATWLAYVEFMQAHPEQLKNINLVRNEGYLKSLKNISK